MNSKQEWSCWLTAGQSSLGWCCMVEEQTRKSCWLIAYQSSLGWCCGWAGLAWHSSFAGRPHELAAAELAAHTPTQTVQLQRWSCQLPTKLEHQIALVAADLAAERDKECKDTKSVCQGVQSLKGTSPDHKLIGRKLYSFYVYGLKALKVMHC